MHTRKVHRIFQELFNQHFQLCIALFLHILHKFLSFFRKVPVFSPAPRGKNPSFRPKAPRLGEGAAEIPPEISWISFILTLPKLPEIWYL